ncbi:MAG TPA: M24 family peptidase [Thermoanaerobaculia bacterium]
MKRAAIAALLLLSACRTIAPAPVAKNDVDASTWRRIRKERVTTLLPRAMRAAEVDAWVIFVRENANDPLATHVGGENAGGTAAILFFLDGDRVRSVALSPAGEATALRDVGLHDRVDAIDRTADVFALAAAELRGARRIAINSGSRAAADGLSYTQRRAFEAALGDTSRLVPSEELVVRWLSVKLPEEVEIMRRAAIVTAQLEEEAYRTIVPGVTRDSDVAAYLKRRMRELGYEDAWAPEQNPNVNSGPDRGHSHATDRVIQPGDIIQTDFGVKVGGVWCTDIQRFAYVLRDGETAPPAEMLARWENGKRGNRIALAAMKPGVRGYDVDAAQRQWMKEQGSEPVPWATGHPVGYWAHDMGPSLGGAQRTTPPAGDSLRQLEPGQTFAFDGFYAWKLNDTETKTISVEEMAVVTATGAEYLMPPQEELILVGGKR